jgi:hypothetical protein
VPLACLEPAEGSFPALGVLGVRLGRLGPMGPIRSNLVVAFEANTALQSATLDRFLNKDKERHGLHWHTVHTSDSHGPITSSPMRWEMWGWGGRSIYRSGSMARDQWQGSNGTPRRERRAISAKITSRKPTTVVYSGTTNITCSMYPPVLLAGLCAVS